MNGPVDSVVWVERNQEFPYMNSFCRACQEAGLKIVRDFRINKKLRGAIGHSGLCFSTGLKVGRILVCGNFRAESVAWPWCYFYEIVPVMWDLWPDCLESFVRFCRRNRVRTVFCTSSQQVERLRKRIPGLNAVWMPEGLDVGAYPMGVELKNRPIDIIEYGRRHAGIHAALLRAKWNRSVAHAYPAYGLDCPTFESLVSAIGRSKISVCYPHCDTRPERAGDVETVTQRYWECMATGTIIVGRAPRELLDLCGYNPVVAIGDDPVGQISRMLSDIDQGEYQDLANRNRKYVESHVDWAHRVRLIKESL